MPKQLTTKEPLVLVSKQAGVSVIPSDTLLTRLNYFDGKFLRADDLRAEQQYLRHLVQFSNQAGGHGVAYGYGVELASGGDTLNVGPGLAIDPAGRVLLLPQPVSIGVQQLIEQSKELMKVITALKAGEGSFADCEFVTGEPPANVPQAGNLYLITISHAEAYCGQEDVYGKLCEEACATSTDRPFIVEGVVLRAVPLLLGTLLPTSQAVLLSQKHLRSRVASAYFNDERNRTPSLISGAGLKSSVWCFGAEAATGFEVPIAVIARAGTSTIFLDAWTARRERIDTEARRYWQWRMRMRPWDVFLAQVLQFQCQLRDALKTAPEPGADDPCLPARRVIAEASGVIAELDAYFADVSTKLATLNLPDPTAVQAALGLTTENFSKYTSLKQKLDAVKDADFDGVLDRLLINHGIIELPPGGYLPVAPGSTVSVNQQVRKMMGEGVDLRFCVVRPDYVAHALEEVQHMERISLLEGLDNPQKKPEVDILVPDGQIAGGQQTVDGLQGTIVFSPDLFELMFNFLSDAFPFGGGGGGGTQVSATFNGAARGDEPSAAAAGRAFHGAFLLDEELLKQQLLAGVMRPRRDIKVGEGGGESPAAEEAAPAEDDAAAGLHGMRPISFLKQAVRGRRRGAARPRQQSSDFSRLEETSVNVPSRFQINSGVWLTMRSDQDPLKIQAGQTLTASGRAVLALSFVFGSRTTSFYLDVQLNATLQVSSVAPGPGGNTLIRASGPVSGHTIIKVQDQKVSEARRVDLDVEIEWNPSGSLRIDADNAQGPGTGRLEATWSGQPQQVTGNISAVHKNNDDVEVDELEMITSNFISNPAVMEPSNEHHTKALSALQIIGTALNEPTFVAIATASLFPPQPPPSDQLIVHGTHDWVLFHRRRTRQCGVETQPVVSAPPRRYNAFHVSDDRPGSVADKIKFIRDNFMQITPEMVAGLHPLGQVEFAAGSATLASDPTALLAQWQAASPGPQIFYGVIASSGAAAQDGQPLALNRLGSVRQAVASVTGVDPNAAFDALSAVPAPLAAPGTDGVIILVTLAESEIVRHDVYRFGFSGGLENIRNTLQAGGQLTADILQRSEAEKIGEVNFDLNTGAVTDNSLTDLETVWIGRGGQVGASLVVSRTGDADAGKAMDQFHVIADEIGEGPSFGATTMSTPHALPDNPRFVSFIRPDFDNV